jgi:hypothetical protein
VYESICTFDLLHTVLYESWWWFLYGVETCSWTIWTEIRAVCILNLWLYGIMNVTYLLLVVCLVSVSSQTCCVDVGSMIMSEDGSSLYCILFLLKIVVYLSNIFRYVTPSYVRVSESPWFTVTWRPRPSRQLIIEHIIQQTACSRVRYVMKLKKRLHMEHALHHRSTRWQHCGTWD